nr:hypothetical protein [Sulfitobacter sp. M368]
MSGKRRRQNLLSILESRKGQAAKETREQARHDVLKYIELFYNTKRKHTNTGMLSPVDCENWQKLVSRKLAALLPFILEVTCPSRFQGFVCSGNNLAARPTDRFSTATQDNPSVGHTLNTAT